jgi:WD40 repeat protein
VAAALLIGTAAATWQAVRATEAEGLAQERLETANANYEEAEKQRQSAKTQEGLANEQRKIALANEKTAKEQELLARRRLYAAQMNLAQQAWEKGDPLRVLDLLENQRPKFDQEDLRGWEWYYLWRLCHSQRRFTLRHPKVRSVAISPDGKMLASGGHDGMIRIWDLARRQLLVSIPSPDRALFNCVAFSPDGMKLATATLGVVLWEVGTWRKLKAFPSSDHTAVHSLAFSPDGMTLAVGMHNSERGGFVKLWDLATGQERAILDGHVNPVLSVAFSPDSRKLASSSPWSSSKVKLWDLTTDPPRLTHDLEATGPVALAAGQWENIRLWDVGTGEDRGGIQVRSGIDSVAISPDGKTLAIGLGNRTLRLWEPATGRSAHIAHAKQVCCVAFTPDGKNIASASGDRIALWDPGQEAPEIILRGQHTIFRPVAYSPDNKSLAYADAGGVVKLCNPMTGQVLATLKAQADDTRSMAFSLDSKRLAIGCFDGANAWAHVWDITRMQEVASFNTGMRDFEITALAPDGQTLALGGAANDLTLWDIDTKHVRRILSIAGWSVRRPFLPTANRC